MCGFAGILGPSNQQELHRMASAIVHRGPDSRGIWYDQSQAVALVHQRLAIVDVTRAGHQPMASNSGRYQLSYNGEIYNHAELRKQLETHDQFCGWRGQSDTETLLTSIELTGLESTLPSLVGMFAFALWDSHANQLHLVRDRIGEKPLYYGWHNQRFLFASELHAFRKSDRFYPGLDQSSLAQYFRHNHFPAPYTVYKGIHKLTPASVITITDEHRRDRSLPPPIPYWSAVSTARLARRSPFRGDNREAEYEVERMLSRSIAQQMVADVPVGAFLSGGVDSGLVTALMQKQSRKPVKTFCIGFESRQFNEANYAREVATRLGTDHNELVLGDGDIQGIVTRLPALLDEPFADSSQLPTLLVSGLAREQVKVSLSGDGGDELFGGYTRYRQAAKVFKYRGWLGLPGRELSRALLGSALTGYGPTGIAEVTFKAAGPHNSLRNPLQKILRGAQLLAHQENADSYSDMLSFWRHPHSPLGDKALEPYANPLTDSGHWIGKKDGQSAIQLLDVQHYLSDDILHKVDRAAMSVSLETRIPMLDHRLMAFVWSLPTSFRANPKKPKALLKAIACRYLPAEHVHRPKAGFGVPLGPWLRGPLRSWAESLLQPAKLDRQGLLDGKVVTLLWHCLLEGNDHYAEALWCVFMLQLWLDSHHER